MYKIDLILNVLGMSLNFIGALMMYYYTPNIFRGAVIYAENTVKQDIKNQKKVKIGMAILTIGFLFSICSIFLGK